MRQMELLGEGERRQRRGLEQVEAGASRDWLAEVRERARTWAETYGRVSTDDLRAWCDREGLQPAHRNAWGAIFREPEWYPVALAKSWWPSNHGRMIRIWRLRGGPPTGGPCNLCDIPSTRLWWNRLPDEDGEYIACCWACLKLSVAAQRYGPTGRP